MSANAVFVQALADACGRPVEVSPQLEATTLGAGLLAGLATGTWDGSTTWPTTWSPRTRRRAVGAAQPTGTGGAGRPSGPASGTRS